MHDMDWDNIRYFLALARTGTVAAAARTLGVNQTTVSRRITALEQQLDRALFVRSGKGWLLTGGGEQLVILAEHMAEQASAIRRQALADSQALSGLLRVTVADVCTQRLVMPALEAFTRQYPDVELEVVATREELNLALREADVALRATDKPPVNLVGKSVGTLSYGVYATEENRARIEADPQRDDLACITWLGDGHSRPAWVEKSFPNLRRLYRTNELGVIVQMAEHGMGLAQIPCVLGERSPHLHRVAARHVEAGWGLWVLSHVDVRTTARVRIFRDFLWQSLQRQPYI